jgi:hypothetical protein
VTQLEAGSDIVATSVAVLSGGNKPVRSAVLSGARTALTVTQTLRYHREPETHAAATTAPIPTTAASNATTPATAKSRRGRKDRPSPDGNDGGGAEADEGEMVLRVRNPSPIQNQFQFEALTNGLKHVGRYSLEFCVEQVPHVKVTCDIRVKAGTLASVALEAPPTQLCARLGGTLAPNLRLLLHDAFQNVMEGVKETPEISFHLHCAATGTSRFAATPGSALMVRRWRLIGHFPILYNPRLRARVDQSSAHHCY